MVELLRRNNKIIINSDIDGVLSGLILTNYANCEVVGFSNSDNTVWIDNSKVNSIYNAVYVDMFVADNNVKCIDQHIVSVNEQHHRILSSNQNKLNPNFENPRFHLPNNSYYNKYPFGTIHYLIAVLESEGIRVDLNFMNPVGQINFIDLLLRADDAMKTTVDSNYMVNASSWWRWLIQKSGNARSINSMLQYLNTLNAIRVSSIKQTTTSLLTNSATFGCSSPDGGYKSIIDDNGMLLSKVINYFNFIAQSSGLNCFDLNLNLTPCIGRVNRVSLTNNQIEELINQNSINGEKIFSYAFVRSANRGENFSYTIM
jgi:hypothetical protein